METKDYLKYLVEKIHTTIVATTDENDHPVTSAIDMMDYDENHIYFLTAKGKGFYRRLKMHPHIALTGLKGEDTMHSKALSITGEVKELGSAYTKKLFDKNTYMYEIYPTEESRDAISVFVIYKGQGEWFDLSKKPIERDSFSFGEEIEKHGYKITDSCIGCGQCLDVCPQSCIESDDLPFNIEEDHCLHCGNCFNVCPVKAVDLF